MKRAFNKRLWQERDVEFAKKLVKHIWIVSTSGTAKLLQENNIKIKTIEELTNHPKYWAVEWKTSSFGVCGLACRTDLTLNIKNKWMNSIWIIWPACSCLYPSAIRLAKKLYSPWSYRTNWYRRVSLIRAAAKNYTNVSVLVNPSI